MEISKGKEKAKMNIEKAKDKRTEFMNKARGYCGKQGLKEQCRIIEDMEWPSTWHLKKRGWW
jgi:hypothetical protein